MNGWPAPAWPVARSSKTDGVPKLELADGSEGQQQRLTVGQCAVEKRLEIHVATGAGEDKIETRRGVDYERSWRGFVRRR